MTEQMMKQFAEKGGFVAALDQSGGSTPGALRQYGIGDDAYTNDAEMFDLMHQMRVRVMTAPAFTGDKVIGAILFEATMNGKVNGIPTAAFLWDQRGVVPFLKVDKGLDSEASGVRLMKPIPGLDALLERAKDFGVFGTKMRSVIRLPDEAGIAAIARQQFEIGAQIARHGLMPILEPEVVIDSPDKKAAEQLLLEAISTHLDGLPPGERIVLKLTIPDIPDLYKPLIEDPRVVRVLALSGGYTRDDACERLVRNHGMIASFSRALLDDLRASMTDEEFNAAIAEAIDKIHRASTVKQ